MNVNMNTLHIQVCVYVQSFNLLKIGSTIGSIKEGFSLIRIRMTLPKRKDIAYRNMDILHDAIVNAWICAGAASEMVTGYHARPWNFAALGWRRRQESRVHTLVISTPDPDLSVFMGKFNAENAVYARAKTAEAVDFSRAEISVEPDPVAPGQTAIGVLMLSPLAISLMNKGKKGHRWHSNLGDVDLSKAVNHRLSRITGRKVSLEVQADRLYLRANPKHDVLIPVKEFPKGKRAFVIGMKAPLVLSGSEADLRLAWYAGIGEKTRGGFGCVGLVEKGVGR